MTEHSTPTGANLLAGAAVKGAGAAIRAVDPRTGQAFGPPVADADLEQLAQAVGAAGAAAPALAADRSGRAALLDTIAEHLDAEVGALVAVADAETGLGQTRLQGEVGRTTGQLRRFAAVVRDGRYLDAIIDTADATTTPPRPDLRRMLVPLGPVAVFGASNFPFAFSVAGGDTASALAAGCPVIAKAHPAHPGTSEAVARIVSAAIADRGLPGGTFSLVHGAAPAVGIGLVTHPVIAAVGFTGSTAGGRALYDAAAARRQPIPVYAEMGSSNPVVLTEAALTARGDTIASALAGSVLQSMGQFCTKPGVLIAPAGPAGDAFVAALTAAIRTIDLHALLTPGIANAFRSGAAGAAGLDGVEVLLDGPDGDGALRGPVVVGCDADTFLAEPALREECFGPYAIVVRTSPDRLLDVVDALDGMLVATVHAEPDDLVQLQPVVARLADRAGRVVFNGVPTGVAVTTAQQHGGPYPATTAPGTTSVGDRAIQRWLRPVAYQDAPPALLPAELRDENPGGLWRTIDGELTTADVDQVGSAPDPGIHEGDTPRARDRW